MPEGRTSFIAILCLLLLLLSPSLVWTQGHFIKEGDHDPVAAVHNSGEPLREEEGTSLQEKNDRTSRVSNSPGDLTASPFISESFPERWTFSSYLLGSSLKTILILFLAFMVWILLIRVFKEALKGTVIIKEKYPDIEKRLCLYCRAIKKSTGILLIFVSALLILQSWGIKIFSFLALYSQYVYALMRIPLIVVMGLVLIQISRFVISRTEGVVVGKMKSRPGASEIEVQKQIKTVGELVYKTVVISIWVIALMMIMKELGFDIKPILAGAGIIGLAVGFGAQNLVRDVISGLFMTVENQIRVGDVAILNGTGGLVEAINLRTTVLRGVDGAIHVFPNGSINTLSNLTHNFSYYVFDICVAYKEDVDRVIAVLKQISSEIMGEPAYASEIIEPLDVLGLDSFSDSAIVIKARIKTKPTKQWMIGREMNRRIKKRFDEEHIEIPFPHRTLYFGDAGKPFDLQLKDNTETKQMVKKWVKEVMEEGKDKQNG